VLDLSNVFLREDEILSTDGAAAVSHLSVISGALQAAVWAGARWPGSRCAGMDADTYFSELRSNAANGTLTTAHLSAVRARAARPAFSPALAAPS
jgi:hypothetical protein